MQRYQVLSELGNIGKRANRDKRKVLAIARYKSGLDVNEIAKTMGISTRTVNRYLESHTRSRQARV